MPNKNRSSRTDRRSAKTRQKMNMQIAGIGIVVLVGVAILWVSLSNRKPSGNTAQEPALVGTKQYSSAPPMLIDKSKSYTATVK
ncbi:MAG: hypothetical protein ACM3PY_17915, partial [Omnitrophica WOR_2 bacterium]